MRRAWLLGALLAFGCGTARPDVREPSSEGIESEVAGVRLLAVPRPTAGRVWLSLWIDAGARDASPRQSAALAAWIAAAEAPGIEGRALADGVELALPCRIEELDSCLERLAAAASTRRVDDAALSAARQQLLRARRGSAGSLERASDSLAIEALLGAPIDPLGSPDEEATTAQVADFLADHFGTGRLLLVAVGDVDANRLGDAVQRTFGDVPAARRERSDRRAEPRRAARVEVGDAGAVSLASLLRDPDAAAHLARRLLARTRSELPAPASAEVFPIRGGALLVVHARGDATSVADTLLEHWTELRDEPASQAPPARPADGPLALARWLGARWVAGRGEDPPSAGLGLGVVVDGGRGDDTSEADPDAARRAESEARIATALERATAPVALEGEVGPERVDARVGPDGARILGARVPGAAAFGLTISFSGGPQVESEAEHGMSALLARAAAAGCRAVAVRELGTSLDALGIEVTPILVSGAWGLSFVAPRERWPELTHLAPHCARVPTLSPDLLEAARDALLGRMDADDVLRGQIARSLSPSAPGRVAPLGARDTLRTATLRQLRRWRDAQVVGARARVGFAGDVEVERAARRLARLLRRWPPGSSAEPAPWAPGSDRMRSIPRSEGLAAVIGWVVPAEPHASAARAFAEAVAGSLAAEPGVAPIWSDGGAELGHAWAAVAVRLDPEALEALPARTGRALRAIGHAWPELAERATTQTRADRAWAGASPRGLATALSLGDADPPPADEGARLMRSLAETAPYVIVARPQPGEVDRD